MADNRAFCGRCWPLLPDAVRAHIEWSWSLVKAGDRAPSIHLTVLAEARRRLEREHPIPAAESGPAGACPPRASEGRSGLPGTVRRLLGQVRDWSPSGIQSRVAAFAAGPGGPRGDHVCEDGRCCGCGETGVDQYAIRTPDGDHGFGHKSCMVAFFDRAFPRFRPERRPA